MADIEMNEESALMDRIIKLEEQLQEQIAVRRQLGEHFQKRTDDLERDNTKTETDVENLMTAMEHLTATVEMILPRISELQMWRDTGAIHRQCKVCDQLVAVTAYNHLTPHGRPEWSSGWCPNSGNVAS